MRLLELLAALGAAQGFLLLTLILLRYRHIRNLSLSLLVLAFSLRLGTIPSWRSEILLAWPWLWAATTPLPLLFGPLLWLYVRGLAAPDSRPPPFLSLHFLPYAIEVLLISSTIIRMDTAEYTAFVGSVFAGYPPLWLPLRNLVKVIVNLVYVLLTARLVFRKQMELPGSLKIWLRTLIVLPVATLLSYAIVAVSPAATAGLAAGAPAPFVVLSVLMAVLIYTISFLVLAAPQALTGGEGVWLVRGEPTLSESECRRLSDAAVQLLERDAFLDPDLRLQTLALRLGVHPNRLSTALNRGCGRSFRQLLNSMRTEEFIRLVEEQGADERTILDLALEAGFPSKSTFNRVFKQNTGKSPTEFLQSRRRRGVSDDLP